MPDRDTRLDPSTHAFRATAEQGAVLLDGPKGAVVALTPAAAEATARSLRRAAAAAAQQTAVANEADARRSVLLRLRPAEK